MTTPCSMGVGCDEYGVCYAAANGEPWRCPRDFERAMSPDPTKEGTIFYDHNCSFCNSGAEPCLYKDSRQCPYPRARND